MFESVQAGLPEIGRSSPMHPALSCNIPVSDVVRAMDSRVSVLPRRVLGCLFVFMADG